jgi:hypothetical protein
MLGGRRTLEELIEDVGPDAAAVVEHRDPDRLVIDELVSITSARSFGSLPIIALAPV